ncbi:hypothetical protein GTP55_26235 [Duganella sp. FT109W]|uniref:Uncharacterized protein n=1 Tax=Duganella margarita TaxID=2692170 RepID=A0ABW9WNR1_9BURK|nr:hypothetical protein [Duganella margarita]MYN42847.1 hypothetical protein [Duganella margarita]
MGIHFLRQFRVLVFQLRERDDGVFHIFSSMQHAAERRAAASGEPA